MRVDAQKPNKKALATSREWLQGSLSAWYFLLPLPCIFPLRFTNLKSEPQGGWRKLYELLDDFGRCPAKGNMQNRTETGWAQRARPVPVASFRAMFYVLCCLRLLRKSRKSRHTHTERERESTEICNTWQKFLIILGNCKRKFASHLRGQTKSGRRRGGIPIGWAWRLCELIDTNWWVSMSKGQQQQQ